MDVDHLDPQQIINVLGRNVRFHRQRLGYSQEELAEKANLHRTYIGLIERGENNPTILSYAKIAQVLNMSIFHLMHSHLPDAE
ncbi:MAG: helix-turn-helix transcriptional regulator [Chlorobiaceae bacterium]